MTDMIPVGIGMDIMTERPHSVARAMNTLKSIKTINMGDWFLKNGIKLKLFLRFYPRKRCLEIVQELQSNYEAYPRYYETYDVDRWSASMPEPQNSNKHFTRDTVFISAINSIGSDLVAWWAKNYSGAAFNGFISRDEKGGLYFDEYGNQIPSEKVDEVVFITLTPGIIFKTPQELLNMIQLTANYRSTLFPVNFLTHRFLKNMEMFMRQSVFRLNHLCL